VTPNVAIEVREELCAFAQKAEEIDNLTVMEMMLLRSCRNYMLDCLDTRRSPGYDRGGIAAENEKG
jgi:hypothetical protein